MIATSVWMREMLLTMFPSGPDRYTYLDSPSWDAQPMDKTTREVISRDRLLSLLLLSDSNPVEDDGTRLDSMDCYQIHLARLSAAELWSSISWTLSSFSFAPSSVLSGFGVESGERSLTYLDEMKSLVKGVFTLSQNFGIRSRSLMRKHGQRKQREAEIGNGKAKDGRGRKGSPRKRGGRENH